MNIRLKKTILVLFIFVSIVAMTACGGNPSKSIEDAEKILSEEGWNIQKAVPSKEQEEHFVAGITGTQENAFFAYVEFKSTETAIEQMAEELNALGKNIFKTIKDEKEFKHFVGKYRENIEFHVVMKGNRILSFGGALEVLQNLSDKLALNP